MFLCKTCIRRFHRVFMRPTAFFFSFCFPLFFLDIFFSFPELVSGCYSPTSLLSWFPKVSLCFCSLLPGNDALSLLNPLFFFPLPVLPA